MIDEYRIFFIDGMKIMGQISDVTANVVVVRNPVEIQYEETEYGQVIVVSDPIRESNSRIINLLKSNISLTCDVSQEMIVYYDNVVKQFWDHREKTRTYLSQLSNIMVEQQISKTVLEQIIKGKMIQPSSDNIN